jgi:hypothetical protein
MGQIVHKALAVLAQTIKSRESHPVASQTSSDNRSRRINASPTDVLSMNDISQALAEYGQTSDSFGGLTP